MESLAVGPVVALVGLSGAGKSTIAPLLAARLGGVSADLDARIEARAGLSIGQLFATRGETAFRELESAELMQALSDGARVIACGGGIVESPGACLTLRERCHTVWLEVDSAEAVRRMGSAVESRPLLASDFSPEALARLLERRATRFSEVARTRLRTDDLTPDEIAGRILRAVASRTIERKS